MFQLLDNSYFYLYLKKLVENLVKKHASLKSTSDKGSGKRLFGKIMGFGHSVTSGIQILLLIWKIGLPQHYFINDQINIG